MGRTRRHLLQHRQKLGIRPTGREIDHPTASPVEWTAVTRDDGGSRGMAKADKGKPAQESCPCSLERWLASKAQGQRSAQVPDEALYGACMAFDLRSDTLCDASYYEKRGVRALCPKLPISSRFRLRSILWH